MSKRVRAQFWMEFWTDLICLVLANAVAYLLFHGIFHKILDYSITDWGEFVAISILSFIVIFVGFHNNINIHKRSRINELSSVIKNATLTYMTVLVFIVLLKNPILESRYFIVSGYTLSVIFSTFSRYFLKRWITGYFTNSKVASIVGIITTSDIAQEFVENVKGDWALKISGIAILDEQFNISHSVVSEKSEIGEKTIVKERTKLSSICDIPVVADSEDFMQWIRSAPLDEVFINLPYDAVSDVQDIIEELEDMGIVVHLNLSMLSNLISESKFDNISCKTYANTPIATFTPAEISTGWMIIKRLIDILGGLVGCVCSIPIILITAIPLLLESPGPLIFKQERIGRNGRPFKIYKLRSMYVDAEERKAELMKQNQMDGLMFKMDNDPRITKVGKIIRKFSIDELPQFFNVLKGDMSLIGTRPPTVNEFMEYESHHKRRLSMRPGITGMWQVSGRSNIQNFEEVVKLDCEYIDNWSPILDTKIFMKTIYVVLTHQGAE